MSLLDDVSIVVTPNGYKAGELYAVVPAASLGNNVIVNGDFATDSDWNKGTGWTISGGSANCDGNQTGATNLTPNVDNVTNNTVYKTTYTISNYVSGSIRIKLGNTGQGQYHSANGTYTEEIKALVTTFPRSQFNADVDFKGSIDNVLVEEVISADMDVTRATAATRVDEAGLVNYAEIVGSELITDGNFPTPNANWTIQGGAATTWVINNNIATRTGSTNWGLYQNITRTVGSLYKITFNVLTYTSGNLQVRLGDGATNNVTNTGSKTLYLIWDGSTDKFAFEGSFIGSIENVSVKEATRDNVPRIDYTGGGCPHILAEPQRTNLYPHSDNSSTWSKSNFTTTDNYATSPDGTTNAFRGVSTSNASLLYIGSTGSAGTNTISIYAKSNTASDQKFRFFGNGNTTQSSDQTVTQEWQRFEYTETFSFVTWGLAGASVSGTNDILFYGMQHEIGSFPTSYIPTSGSTVTRNQDQFTRDGIGSLINSTEGVLFLEMAALSDDLSARRISINDSSYNNIVEIGYTSGSNEIKNRVKSGGGTQANMNYTAPSILSDLKIALKWKVNDFSVWVNGVEVATDTLGTAPIGLSKISFDRGDGTQKYFGKVKQLQVYKTALTDEQLLQLTGTSGTDFYESYAEMASALTYTIQ